MNLQKSTLLTVYALSALFCAGQNYNFQSYNVEDGIPQSQVNTVFADSRGYIWFGTAGGGICSFDGREFESFAEMQGLSGPIVNDITEDLEGNIWVASTWGGLSKYNGKEFTIYSKSKGFEPGSAAKLVCDTEGNIWAGGNGLWKCENDRFSQINVPEGIELAISDIIVGRDGVLWLATTNGLAYISENNEVVFVSSNMQGINAVGQHANGELWIGLASGGVLSSNPEVIDFQPVADLPNVTVQDFYLAKDSSLWFSTSSKGVFQVIDGVATQFDKNNGLSNNYVHCITEDREGDMWFGTHGSGALKYTGKAFTYFDFIDGFNREDIFAIAEIEGEMWVGTARAGIFVWDGNQVINYTTQNGLPSNMTRQIIETTDGSIWITTDKGASKFNGTSFTTYSKAQGLPDNNIRCIIESDNGSLWFGTYNGISNYKNGAFINYTEDEGIPYRYVHSLHEDAAGYIWIGTGSGLYRYDGTVFTNHSAGLCNSYVGSIGEDKWGNLWVYTDRCISRYNGQTHKSVTEYQGLSSNTVFLIQFDAEGNLWVGTNRGIDKITFTENGTIDYVTNYSKDEGFKGIECNTRASAIDDDGNLWFGTVTGAIKYNAQFDVRNDVEPSTHITGIKLFQEDTDWSQHATDFSAWHHTPTSLELPFYKNYLTFSFVGISMRLPDRVTHQFMLEGFDRDWLPVTQANEATYSNLPPGKYTFKVKSANEHGVWNIEPATFGFVITAPVWQRWWFYLIIFGTFLFGIYLMVKARTKNLSKQKLLLEHQVELRVEEISRQNKEKEVMLKEIHHRVKNNLQIINSLISLQSNFVQDEKALALFDECRNRVSSMALIHEKMYETKDLANIKVNEYVADLVENLIQTYGINQRAELNFDIRVSTFDIDTIVPFGLLINEIVSNSLKYAFKDGGGTIFVKLKQKDNRYELEIGDNGIGFPEGFVRAKSETLGMQLIDVLAEQLGGTVEVRTGNGVIYYIVFEGAGR